MKQNTQSYGYFYKEMVGKECWKDIASVIHGLLDSRYYNLKENLYILNIIDRYSGWVKLILLQDI